MLAAGFSWFHMIPVVDRDELLTAFGITSHNHVYIHAWLACGLLILFALAARNRLEAARGREGIEAYFADDRLTVRNIAELVIGGIRGFMSDLLGPADLRAFFPLVGAIFLYVFTCNIMGLIPGFLQPTSYLNTSAGLAVIVFVVFNYVGFSRDAVGYLKHMWGPMFVLGFLLFPIEIVSLCIRPYALTLRLTGNMFGDHTVFTIMSGLVPIGVPAALLLLAIVVSTIQAFVFALLTCIYIQLSLPHHEDAH